MTLNTRLYANNAKTTLASAILATDTTITVANGSAFPNPAPGTNEYFLVTIDTGSSYEIIYVAGRTGNTFTGCIRGYENTTAAPYQAGTRIENRATAGTFASFTRFQDVLAEIASVDALSPPSSSDSNSYLTASTDDGGNPVVAVFNSSPGTWRFVNYPTLVTSSTVASTATTTSISVTGASTLLPIPNAGKYVLQFVTGANKGLCRAITSVSSTTISWATALPQVPSIGDGFEIYKSEVSTLSDLSAAADDSLIFAIILGN